MIAIKGGLSMLLATLIITGCTSHAASIQPVTVPSANYEELGCTETRAMLAQKTGERDTLAESVDSQYLNTMALGGMLGGVIYASNGGVEKEERLAQLKGEVTALEGAVLSNCEGS